MEGSAPRARHVARAVLPATPTALLLRRRIWRREQLPEQSALHNRRMLESVNRQSAGERKVDGYTAGQV